MELIDRPLGVRLPPGQGVVDLLDGEVYLNVSELLRHLI